uniref:Uncharacterized protein n=1 Tax=Hanusia phi TaxID=3032 RepID=A0A7S0HSE3_9CRYP|mmetsp:Transcript_33761/g.75835  ORF Transcript_33761/g.75835 Transcript_33761/m.75835 type:complete len:476 (+) Transcript_33761:250-1677(+)
MSYRDDHLCEFRGRVEHRSVSRHRSHHRSNTEEHSDKAPKLVKSEFKVDAVSQIDRPYLPYIPHIAPFVRSPSCEIGSAWSRYRNLLLDVGCELEESRQMQRMNVLFNKIHDPTKAGITAESLLEGLNSLGLLKRVDITEASNMLRELLKSPQNTVVEREAFYDFMIGLSNGEEQHWDAIPHIEGNGLRILQRSVSSKKESAMSMKENIQMKLNANKDELIGLTKEIKSLQKKHGAASTKEMERIEKKIKRRMKEMQLKESQMISLSEEAKIVEGRSKAILQEATVLQDLADRVMQFQSVGARFAMLTLDTTRVAHGKHSMNRDEEITDFIIESKIATGSWAYISFEVEHDWTCFEIIITALHGTAYLAFANPPLLYRAASGSLHRHRGHGEGADAGGRSGWQRGPGYLVKRNLAKTGYYGMECTVRMHLSPAILLGCYPGGFGKVWQGVWHLGVHGPSTFKVSVMYFMRGDESS